MNQEFFYIFSISSTNSSGYNKHRYIYYDNIYHEWATLDPKDMDSAYLFFSINNFKNKLEEIKKDLTKGSFHQSSFNYDFDDIDYQAVHFYDTRHKFDKYKDYLHDE